MFTFIRTACAILQHKSIIYYLSHCLMHNDSARSCKFSGLQIAYFASLIHCSCEFK